MPLVAWVVFLFFLLLLMYFLRGTNVLLGSAVTAVDLAKFVVFLSPFFLQQALPIAYLLGILLGVGRLSEDQETTAMRSMGVGVAEMLQGPILISGFLAVVSLSLSFFLTPMGLRATKETVNEIIKRNLMGDVKSGVFYDELSNFTLYAEKVDSDKRTWMNVLVDDERDSTSSLLVLAKSGVIQSEGHSENLKLVLEDGVMHRPQQEGDEYTTLQFATGEFRVGVGETFFRKNRFQGANEELTWLEIRKALQEPSISEGDMKSLKSSLYFRGGLALMPLSLAMLGTPLAMARRQGSRARGVLLTLLGIIFYYVLNRVAMGWAERGSVHILVASQTANGVFIAVGLFLLRRTARVGASQ